MTTKLQNAISAAAYLKCAEMVRDVSFKFPSGSPKRVLIDETVDAIRAAIPADDMQDLRELLKKAFLDGYRTKDTITNKEYEKKIDEILGSAK